MLEKYFRKEVLSDKPMLALLIANVSVAVISIVRVVLSVQQYDFKITVRYTQYGSNSFQLGDWYALYDMALFAGFVTIITTAIALRLHSENRNLALVLLSLQMIVMLFLAFVSGALLDIPSVTS